MDQRLDQDLLVIEGADVLTPAGWRKSATIVIRGGVIEEIGSGSPAFGRHIAANGLTALPGMVDIHGDAFERHITPRAGVHFPVALALESNDASLVASGITTFFYSITDGFEPGLRSRANLRELLRALEETRHRLLCDSRIHVRHEQANTENHAEVLGWLADGTIDLLSLNNHLPPPGDGTAFERYLAGFKRRIAMGEGEARDFIHGLQDRIPLGARQSGELAARARDNGVPLASHDDKDAADAERALALGVTIAEFPMTAEVAKTFRGHGVHVLMGAPNGVRGKSHVSGIGVRESVASGLVDVLCSDYHYPSLLHAPFLLNELGLMDFAEAWALVSRNPAESVGLGRVKGSLEPGMAADILLLRGLGGTASDLQATLVGGKIVLQRH